MFSRVYLTFDLTFLILPFQALERICDEAADAIQGEIEQKGVQGVILSDAMAGPDRMALPSLLSVGAVHQHLLKTKQRPKVRI
jgi:glutamate synthase (NADPH/NADH)